MAKKEDCIGLSFTYNEPTIWFEYTLDCSKLAKKEGLLTNYVTNGFITKDALDEIGEYLDSFRVDVKGFSKKSYSMIAHIEGFDGIMEVTKRAKHKWDMHIEIITNIIPTFNDDEYQLKGIANWINDELGADTPWHLTRFVPNFKLSHIDYTPIETLEKAREIGFDSGLLYVYLGNVSGHKGENTYCPYCNKLLVERDSYSILRYNIIDGKCPVCKKSITGRWK
jgi:pyruvate formate lyase activating enzyme